MSIKDPANRQFLEGDCNIVIYCKKSIYGLLAVSKTLEFSK